MTDKLAEMRYEYTKEILFRKDLNPNPYQQFNTWFDQITPFDPMGANAFTLSTIGEGNRPSGRIILLKGVEGKGFVFYTNYGSRKAKEMNNQQLASMCFFWGPLERQLRIEGRIVRVSAESSDAYFQSRPRESQLGAHVSPQSDIIADRSYLEDKFKAVEEMYAEGTIPRPEQWGGYALIPDYFEFWQGRANRLHDRFSYTLIDGDWKINRLAP